MKSASTRLVQHMNAPRSAVYQAILDAESVATWMVPTGMHSQIHMFEPHEGGRFRISLTYDNPQRSGKTTANTDTYHGSFIKLVPNEQVVQLIEFETDDPMMKGQMTVTITLSDSAGGTELLATHDNLPPGVPPADNELGWRMSLEKLAKLVETRVAR
ncbi:MAG: Aha1 protein [Massilia sp.]|jgi:uncharacterized protein YndB with AHSA1/START domain|nr:Aha1 protein [Massilia sp.]